MLRIFFFAFFKFKFSVFCNFLGIWENSEKYNEPIKNSENSEQKILISTIKDNKKNRETFEI